MAEPLDVKTARALERSRSKILGDAATITLLDRQGATIITATQYFMVERKSDLALGESWLQAEISEHAGVTQAHMLKLVSITFKGARYSASQNDDPQTEARTWLIRLTPITRKTT
jgi:hypothetical protein